MVVIEMNPRVSRSSALASKATGFPIAKVAAKLAVGYTLDELENEITGGATPASFEPTIDYIVTKIPRFAFEKFPASSKRLTTQMKSVGEAMAIGRTFKESLQKALRSLEVGLDGFDELPLEAHPDLDAEILLKRELREAGPERILYVAEAFRRGIDFDEVQRLSRIDPWFLDQILEIIEFESVVRDDGIGALDGPRCISSSVTVFPTPGWRASWARRKRSFVIYGRRWTFSVSTSGWIPVRRNSRPLRHISTAPGSATARPNRPTGAKSWFWAAGRTGSGRASSSTTAACTQRWPCANSTSRPSW